MARTTVNAKEEEVNERKKEKLREGRTGFKRMKTTRRGCDEEDTDK